MRLIILLLLPLLLTSCYRPIYGERPFGADATQQENRLNRIFIKNIPDESGQKLRNFLIDRMYGSGRPDKTDATLTIGLTTSEEDLGLQKDATTLRKKVSYKATYLLTDNTTQKSLRSGSVRTFVSYDKIDAQYGVLVSREASLERAMRELSDLIVGQLLVYYGQRDVFPAELFKQQERELEQELQKERREQRLLSSEELTDFEKPSALKKPEPKNDDKGVLF